MKNKRIYLIILILILLNNKIFSCDNFNDYFLKEIKEIDLKTNNITINKYISLNINVNISENEIGNYYFIFYLYNKNILERIQYKKLLLEKNNLNFNLSNLSIDNFKIGLKVYKNNKIVFSKNIFKELKLRDNFSNTIKYDNFEDGNYFYINFNLNNISQKKECYLTLEKNGILSYFYSKEGTFKIGKEYNNFSICQLEILKNNRSISFSINKSLIFNEIILPKKEKINKVFLKGIFYNNKTGKVNISYGSNVKELKYFILKIFYNDYFNKSKEIYLNNSVNEITFYILKNLSKIYFYLDYYNWLNDDYLKDNFAIYLIHNSNNNISKNQNNISQEYITKKRNNFKEKKHKNQYSSKRNKKNKKNKNKNKINGIKKDYLNTKIKNKNSKKDIKKNNKNKNNEKKPENLIIKKNKEINKTELKNLTLKKENKNKKKITPINNSKKKFINNNINDFSTKFNKDKNKNLKNSFKLMSAFFILFILFRI